jgi:hypothetical protein
MNNSDSDDDSMDDSASDNDSKNSDDGLESSLKKRKERASITTDSSDSNESIDADDETSPPGSTSDDMPTSPPGMCAERIVYYTDAPLNIAAINSKDTGDAQEYVLVSMCLTLCLSVDVSNCVGGSLSVCASIFFVYLYLCFIHLSVVFSADLAVSLSLCLSLGV